MASGKWQVASSEQRVTAAKPKPKPLPQAKYAAAESEAGKQVNCSGEMIRPVELHQLRRTHTHTHSHTYE